MGDTILCEPLLALLFTEHMVVQDFGVHLLEVDSVVGIDGLDNSFNHVPWLVPHRRVDFSIVHPRFQKVLPAWVIHLVFMLLENSPLHFFVNPSHSVDASLVASVNDARAV